MASQENRGFFYNVIEKLFEKLARSYIKLKCPFLIVTAGSVGKTSTKLYVGQLLASEKTVNYMGESYNNGLGLYMSVFKIKVPTSIKNPLPWIGRILKALAAFIKPGAEFMVLEYGIDSPGQMDEMLGLAKPDIGILTAVTPEHMEFLKDLDTVAREETKIIRASKKRSFVNEDDIDKKYIPKDVSNITFYGTGKLSTATYQIHRIDAEGALVDFTVIKTELPSLRLQVISEPLIRQLTGAIAVAMAAGVSADGVKKALQKFEPVPGRMRLLRGVNGSSLLDDTVNFSPIAGIRALETLKQFKAKRRVVVFGNMHELGEYGEQGFADVAEHFKHVDMFVFVGSLAQKYFTPAAAGLGHKLGDTILEFDDAVTAGKTLRGKLLPGDAVLIKGPFGGFYLEECTKQLLADPSDSVKLIRQSDFWLRKKRNIFGHVL